MIIDGYKELPLTSGILKIDVPRYRGVGTSSEFLGVKTESEDSFESWMGAMASFYFGEYFFTSLNISSNITNNSYSSLKRTVTISSLPVTISTHSSLYFATIFSWAVLPDRDAHSFTRNTHSLTKITALLPLSVYTRGIQRMSAARGAYSPAPSGPRGPRHGCPKGGRDGGLT